MQYHFSDFILIILKIIVEQKLPPTFSSRLFYLFTSFVRVGLKVIIPHIKICDNYKVETIIIIKYYKNKRFLNNYIIYISIQSIKIIQQMFPLSIIISDFLNNEITQNQKYCLLFKKFLLEEDYLEKINNELNNFYNYRSNDGWAISNEQIPLVNDYKINPNNFIEVEQLENKDSYCLLVGQKMLGANWGSVLGLMDNKKLKKIESNLDKKYNKIDFVKETKKSIRYNYKIIR